MRSDGTGNRRPATTRHGAGRGGAFLLVCFSVPATLFWQASAFLLFRLFDILKPPPIRYYERTFKNGFGVRPDALVAAFYTLMVFAIAKTVVE